MKKTCLSYEQTVDRLRSLPHPIRNHILSLLPMEGAVKTSVLSRQWRYVSSSLSNLEFNQIDYQEKMQNDIHSIDFRNFVDHLIIVHDGTHMGSFSLTVYVDDVLIKDTNINTWIFFAIMHNVQELCLNIESGTVEKLIDCFYSCCSLTVLTLYQLVLRLPEVIHFPNLHKMYLSFVEFHGKNSTQIFFSSFPVLKELILQSCTFHDLNALTISPPKLTDLILNDIYIYKGINICTPNLQQIRYYDLGETPHFSLETFSSLIGAYFSLSFPDDPDNRAIKILMGQCKTVTLSPRGCYLEDLEIEIWPCKEQVKVLILLLRSYPNLQTLQLYFKKLKYFQ